MRIFIVILVVIISLSNNTIAQNFFILGGTAVYDNKQNTALTNTTVYLKNLTGNIIDSTITGSDGRFQFTDVAQGKYKLYCKTKIKYKTPTPAQALLINRTFIGIYTIADSLKILAADLNMDNKVTPIDALAINRRFIQTISKFKRPDWIFDTLRITISKDSLQNVIKGICAGDIDGSYIPPSGFKCGDNLNDSRDGKLYKTVQIGTQCWMAENLNIGFMLTGTQNQSNNQTIEKHCANDDASNCIIYGGLYNWNEMMGYVTTEKAQGICPDGWYIPTDYEWKQLEIYLGMTPSAADLSNTWRGTDQGTKLKLGGSSGYDALLSGGRMSGGGFLAFQQYEYMWSSSESGSDYAWRRCLRSGDPTVGRWNTFPKDFGFSVRCIKN
jgi:uncharacterized protein (TIGR02145 family)